MQESKNKAVLSNVSLSQNDLVVTRHSNLGAISFLYNLVNNNIMSQVEGNHENRQFRNVFESANNNNNRCLVFPLELLLHKKEENINLKEFGDSLLYLLRVIKQQINEMAYSFITTHSLRRIVILIPEHYQNSGMVYEKSKELLKSAFE